MPSTVSRPKPTRLIYLDVLRAIAILLVLLPHAPFRIAEHTFGYPIFYAWKRMGWCGVDLFFVLSGFLVGGLLLSEYRKYGRVNYGRFLMRRAWKIWPAYLVFLLASFAYDVAQGEGSLSQRLTDTASRGWPYLLSIQNYYGPLVERIGHAWSLAVEEHFYLLLPLLLIGLTWLHGQRSKSNDPATAFSPLPWVFVGLTAACLGMRIYAWRAHPVFDEFIHHWPTHVRIDSLMAGVVLAYGVHFARPYIDSLRSRRPAIIGLSMIAFSPFCLPFVKYDHPLSYTLGYTLLSIAAMGIVLIAWLASVPAPGTAPRQKPYSLPIRALARIGTYSYSIYLWHMPFTGPLVMKIRDRIGERYHLWESGYFYILTLAIYIALAIGLGTLMFYAVEKPALVLRDRWFPSRAKTAVPVSPPARDVEMNPTLQPAAA